MNTARLVLLGFSFVPALLGAQMHQAVDLDKAGWRLWLDRSAAWKDDTLYLPQDVRLDKLPVNAPTGGWGVLSGASGISVTLPTTVEEHYWGAFGTRPYNKYEAQRGPDTSFPNGNYLGVSWWWRPIQVPKLKAGQRLVAYFRGARLRAEVYCNGKLCGYSIMGELPFEADLTGAVTSGKPAQLAVRITNPGGHFDWLDFGAARLIWGKYTLPPSRGFGGLDDGIRLAVRDGVSVTDLAAINTPDLHRVRLLAEVSGTDRGYRGPVEFKVSRKGKVVWSGKALVTVAPGATGQISVEANVPGAEAWDLQHPNLYRAEAVLPGLAASDRNVDFGFRFFTAQGIGGDDAKLVLNGKRIVLRSAISWGFWGRNGLWPDQEMAEREVANAKALGLNCLQFHRNIGKAAVLDLQDQKGVLRYEEPGGGKFILGARYTKGPFGPDGEFLTKQDGNDALDAKPGYVEPDSVDTSGKGPDGDGQVFWEKYAEEKIVRMVKRDRSHPSLIMYSLQNEASDLDLRNPRIYRVFRRMHELDPSRVITFFSGGDPRIAQVTMLPYSDTITAGSKTIPYAGWHDVHTCGGPCTYLDNLYKNPLDFCQRQNPDAHKSICIWGEALGAATPDDYDKLVHSFDAAHPSGYELEDMKKILGGYHDFIEKWGFRKAFPTDSSLFQAIGYRTYYFWRRIVEQSRFDNSTDGLVISGWESTTIDNHSGLVDNHRFFKGDPKVIAEACQPELLVIQPRNVIVAKGAKDLIDVYLINEVGRKGPQTLKLVARRPDGSVSFSTSREVSAAGGDTYGQLLAEGIEVPADAAGMLSLEATLTPASKGFSVLKRTDQVEVIDVLGGPLFKSVAVAEPDGEVSATLRDVFHLEPQKLGEVPAGTRLDAIVLAPKQGHDNTPTRRNGEEICGRFLQESLRRVREDGTRLVLWADDNFRAGVFLHELEKSGVIKGSQEVGNLGAPWFGSWFFVRKHWLLDGLPGDCAMDWRYGVSAFSGPSWLHDDPGGANTEGFLFDAPGMEAFVGYGADHNTKVGVSGAVIPYGKGQIVFYCLPQFVRSLQPGDWATNMVVARRLLSNALRSRVGD